MHFLKVSFKRSVTQWQWHFFVQKLCILHVSSIFHIFPHRWRPLKRFAVKPAWMAPWWISSRLTVTWPTHLDPKTRSILWLRQVLVENKRAHLLSRMIDIFEDRFKCILLIFNALYWIVRCMMILCSFIALYLVTSGLQVSLFRQNFYRAEKGLVLCKARIAQCHQVCLAMTQPFANANLQITVEFSQIRWGHFIDIDNYSFSLQVYLWIYSRCKYIKIRAIREPWKKKKISGDLGSSLELSSARSGVVES